ncbi:hypothetical protein [Micromonospora sp. NPDC007230]|uniref:hypothetical protein n=1 Tax=Micromonospora sp. NPDC007230 TaxID=3364237 RepID=UPI0036A7713B
MLIHELLPLFGEVDEVVDLAPEAAELSRHLRLSEGVRHVRCTGQEVGRLPWPDRRLLVALVGEEGPRTGPDELCEALAAAPVGTPALLLLGWPVAELPAHRLLDPLVAAGCQVITAVPLDRVAGHGAYAALVLRRVDRLAVPRPYLLDLDDEPVRPDDDPADLRVALRIANEWLLADLVSRPLRRRLREQETELADLRRRLAELTDGAESTTTAGV